MSNGDDMIKLDKCERWFRLQISKREVQVNSVIKEIDKQAHAYQRNFAYYHSFKERL